MANSRAGRAGSRSISASPPSGQRVIRRVRTPQRSEVADVLRTHGLDVVVVDDELRVQGLDAAGVGELVGDKGLYLHELTLVRSSLEDAFMTLTASSVEYSAGSTAGAAGALR